MFLTLAAEIARQAADSNLGPVVWALLGIISALSTVLGLFLRWFAREAAYWREAFFAQQRHNRELMMPTAQVVRGVFEALPDPGPPGNDHGPT